MIKVLHNNVCSKSRAILEHLDENNVAFEIIDFVKEDNSIAKLFTYRCYGSKAATLPHQRASHLDPIEFNPASFYDDKERMEKDIQYICQPLTK